MEATFGRTYSGVGAVGDAVPRKVKLPIREALPPDRQQFDPPEPAEFKLLKLERPFVTPQGIVLPSTDKYGWPHGDAYEALLKARQCRISTSTTFRGLKFKRRYEALSLNEQRILLSLAFHPYVLDVRDQYGLYNPATLLKALNSRERMLRQHLMTIDVVVTYLLPGSSTLRYHGISIKPESYIADKSELARESRERKALAERGWTWELLRGNAVTDLEYSNNFMMYSTIRDQDIEHNYEEGRWFANVLLKSKAQGNMRSVLGRISRRVGISDDAAHQLFAVAAAYGFLTVDHSRPLRVDLPLHLVR